MSTLKEIMYNRYQDRLNELVDIYYAHGMCFNDYISKAQELYDSYEKELDKLNRCI